MPVTSTLRPKPLALALAGVLALGSAALADETPRVVVIGIDAKTQRELGPFGSSYRALHTELINKLNASGARSIAFAMDFGTNPEYAAETALLARTAGASKAPVTINVYSERDASGALTTYANDPAFAAAGVGEGALVVRNELLITRTPEGVEGATGGVVLSPRVGEVASLPEVALRRAGLLRRGEDLAGLGLVEDVTIGWNGEGEVKEPSVRPKVGKAPLTLSYVDVLRRRPHPAMKGAIVIIGIHDGQRDLHEVRTKTGATRTVPGVHVLAALIQRTINAAAAKHAKDDAAAAAAKAAERSTTSSGNKEGLSRILERQAEPPKK